MLYRRLPAFFKPTIRELKRIQREIKPFQRSTPLTFVVEAVDAVNTGALVVTTQHEEVCRVFDFICEKEDNALQALLATVNVVSAVRRHRSATCANCVATLTRGKGSLNQGGSHRTQTIAKVHNIDLKQQRTGEQNRLSKTDDMLTVNVADNLDRCLELEQIWLDQEELLRLCAKPNDFLLLKLD